MKPRSGESKSEFVKRFIASDLGDEADASDAWGECKGNNEMKVNEDGKTVRTNSRHIEIRTLDCSLLRREMFDGVEHIVAPMVMLTPGVRNNVLYTAEDMTRHTDSWNGRPVVVFHPQNDKGAPISAGKPEVFEQRRVGFVFNAKMDDGKLKAEAWINPVRLKEVHPKCLETILAEKPLEISTGLFTDDEVVCNDADNKEAWPKHNDGKAYYAITRNYRPDHLALLPDKVGACSWADGAGLPRVNEGNAEGARKGWDTRGRGGSEPRSERMSRGQKEDRSSPQKLAEDFVHMIDRGLDNSHFEDNAVEDRILAIRDRVTKEGKYTSDDYRNVMLMMREGRAGKRNEHTMSALGDAANRAITTRFTTYQPSTDPMRVPIKRTPSVSDMTDERIIFGQQVGDDWKLFAIPYTTQDDNGQVTVVLADDEPEEVERITDWRPRVNNEESPTTLAESVTHMQEVKGLDEESARKLCSYIERRAGRINEAIVDGLLRLVPQGAVVIHANAESGVVRFVDQCGIPRNVDASEIVVNAGTSEGAKKGWDVRGRKGTHEEEVSGDTGHGMARGLARALTRMGYYGEAFGSRVQFAPSKKEHDKVDSKKWGSAYFETMTPGIGAKEFSKGIKDVLGVDVKFHPVNKYPGQLTNWTPRMKAVFTRNEEDDLRDNAGTSEGAKKAWDTRGRGRKGEEGGTPKE